MGYNDQGVAGVLGGGSNRAMHSGRSRQGNSQHPNTMMNSLNHGDMI